jgi:F-type H+-transporting ATPase subunit b
MLDLDPGMMIWTWVTFISVFVILYKVALKPMLQTINNREEQIRHDIDQAKLQREEAQEMLKKHQELLESAETQAQQILKENQRQAEQSRQALMEETRRQADQILDNAKKEIEQQKQSALMELRKEVADLAVGAAEKVIRQKLDPKEHEAVINEYIKSMPKSIDN